MVDDKKTKLKIAAAKIKAEQYGEYSFTVERNIEGGINEVIFNIRNEFGGIPNHTIIKLRKAQKLNALNGSDLIMLTKASTDEPLGVFMATAGHMSCLNTTRIMSNASEALNGKLWYGEVVKIFGEALAEEDIRLARLTSVNSTVTTMLCHGAMSTNVGLIDSGLLRGVILRLLEESVDGEIYGKSIVSMLEVGCFTNGRYRGLFTIDSIEKTNPLIYKYANTLACRTLEFVKELGTEEFVTHGKRIDAIKRLSLLNVGYDLNDPLKSLSEMKYFGEVADGMSCSLSITSLVDHKKSNDDTMVYKNDMGDQCAIKRHTSVEDILDNAAVNKLVTNCKNSNVICCGERKDGSVDIYTCRLIFITDDNKTELLNVPSSYVRYLNKTFFNMKSELASYEYKALTFSLCK